MKSLTEKNNLLLLNIAVFLLNQTYIAPVSLLFYHYNNLTLSEFVFFQSLYALTCVLMEIPAGYIGDIFPRKYILIFSHLLLLLKVFLWLNYKGYIIILIGELLFALSKSFSRGIVEGYIFDFLKKYNCSFDLLKKCGKYNFWVSLGTAVSAIIGVYLYKYLGFKILLLMEFIFIILSVILLLFIQNLPVINNQRHSFMLHIKNILQITKDTLSNSNINSNILYSAILTSLTAIYVWTFQPSMIKVGLPVILFGVLFFFNHFVRAMCSGFSQSIIKNLPLKKFTYCTFIASIFSFLAIITCQHISNMIVCLVLLLFVCLTIGLNLVYSIFTITRILEFVPGATKATSTSVSNMSACLLSAISLYFYKVLLNYISISKIFLLFMILYIILFFLIHKNNKQTIS